MNFAEIFAAMGVVGWAVMGTLLGLSIYSVSVILDRFRRYRAAKAESAAFAPVFAQYLREGKLQDAIRTANQHQKSHVARVVSAGVAEFVEGGGAGNVESRVQLVSRALDRSVETTLSDMKRGLGGLATIGSTAPFIGLFGTVVGIINAFDGIASTGSGGVAAVSGGISEALVATALGLLVAIPAVMAFNYFTGILERFQIEMNTASAELVDFLTKHTRAAHATR